MVCLPQRAQRTQRGPCFGGEIRRSRNVRKHPRGRGDGSRLLLHLGVRQAGV